MIMEVPEEEADLVNYTIVILSVKHSNYCVKKRV